MQEAAGNRDGLRFVLCTLGDLHRSAVRVAPAVRQLRAAYLLFSEIGDADAVARVGDRLAALGAYQPVT